MRYLAITQVQPSLLPGPKSYVADRDDSQVGNSAEQAVVTLSIATSLRIFGNINASTLLQQ